MITWVLHGRHRGIIKCMPVDKLLLEPYDSFWYKWAPTIGKSTYLSAFDTVETAFSNKAWKKTSSIPYYMYVGDIVVCDGLCSLSEHAARRLSRGCSVVYILSGYLSDGRRSGTYLARVPNLEACDPSVGPRRTLSLS